MSGPVTALAAALELAEEGLPVFPVQQDKRPYTVHGFKEASTDPRQITSWWRRWPGALVGVPTGHVSGILAIDVDPEGAEWHRANDHRLACGRVHRTRRAHHLLYRYPPDIEIRNSAGRIAPGIDVRGEGGYIVWWPAHGLEAVGGIEDLGVPPGWLLAEFTNGVAAPHEGAQGAGEYISEGQRNHFLSREAYRLRKQGCSVDQIAEVLRALNNARCKPPLPDAELVVIANGKARVPPDGAAPPDAAVHRLADLSPMDYDRVRQIEADALGVRVATLDAEVARVRAALNPGDDAALQGQAVAIDGPEPWPDEVDGAEAVNGTAETLSRHLALPDGAADAMALWTTHAHCHMAFLHSPRLNVTSPERGCGKTLLLDVLHPLTPKAIRTESITTAVLFRLIDKHAPTLLVDEYDAFIHDNEELRGALNAGHKRGGMHLRCEGDQNEVRGFRTFAPVALAGINDLPGTLVDRSIIIRMQRMGADERREPFDERRTEPGKVLCRKLARWARDNFHALEAADPEMPTGVGHRVRDNWRPLFAIADQVGGDWPDRVREAFALLAKPDDAAQSRAEMLLGDFRDLFAKHGDRMASADVVKWLGEMEERPWPEYSRDKPITTRQVAAALRRFKIRPNVGRAGKEVARGYDRDDFTDAFKRYLPPVPPGEGGSDPLHRYNVGGARVSEDLDPLQVEEGVTDRKSPPAKQDAGCNGVTDRKPPTQGERGRGLGGYATPPGVPPLAGTAMARQVAAMATASRTCPRCDGEGCRHCGGMGRLVDDQPKEPPA